MEKHTKNKFLQTLRLLTFSVISLLNRKARKETKNTVFVSRLFALFLFFRLFVLPKCSFHCPSGVLDFPAEGDA